MEEAHRRADPAPEGASDSADAPTTGAVAEPAVMDPSHLTAHRRQTDTCPFFRADRGGFIGPPREAPDPANRCIATGEPQPQSARQQEYVCLTTGHSNCPLFVQGVAAGRKAAERKAAARPAVERGPSTPVIAPGPKCSSQPLA